MQMKNWIKQHGNLVLWSIYMALMIGLVVAENYIGAKEYVADLYYYKGLPEEATVPLANWQSGTLACNMFAMLLLGTLAIVFRNKAARNSLIFCVCFYTFASAIITAIFALCYNVEAVPFVCDALIGIGASILVSSVSILICVITIAICRHFKHDYMQGDPAFIGFYPAVAMMAFLVLFVSFMATEGTVNYDIEGTSLYLLAAVGIILVVQFPFTLNKLIPSVEKDIFQNNDAPILKYSAGASDSEYSVSIRLIFWVLLIVTLTVTESLLYLHEMSIYQEYLVKEGASDIMTSYWYETACQNWLSREYFPIYTLVFALDIMTIPLNQVKKACKVVFVLSTLMVVSKLCAALIIEAPVALTAYISLVTIGIVIFTALMCMALRHHSTIGLIAFILIYGLVIVYYQSFLEDNCISHPQIFVAPAVISLMLLVAFPFVARWYINKENG